ncbi:hypothetical protein [Sanguibacter massiliensis]|uniref:hypothetical protein n=1 Tax=Sanguibacter massiliensis TaxID=1973217 RepID=UPI00101AE815|nr:hypothetical protein [Sanguibacter massiliensis]
MTGRVRPGAGGAADRVSSSSAAASGRTSSADAFERSVRRWMNAYPRRWRVTFGDDLVATALELAEPGRRRLGLREGLALARGGWALRRRERPPLRVRMLTGFGWRVSARDRAAHRAWIVDIALSPWLRLPAQLVTYMPIVLVNLYLWRDLGMLLNIVAAIGLPLSALGPCLVPAWGRRVSRATWRALFPDEPVPPLLERPARSAR